MYVDDWSAICRTKKNQIVIKAAEEVVLRPLRLDYRDQEIYKIGVEYFLITINKYLEGAYPSVILHTVIRHITRTKHVS